MFRSLRSRLLALLTGIVVLTVGTLGIVSGELLRHNAETTLTKELRHEALNLRHHTGNDLTDLTNSQVFAVDGASAADGVAKFDSDDGAPSRDIAHLKAGQTREVQWHQRGGSDMIGVATAADNDIVVVARKRSEVTNLWRPLALQVAAILAAALVVAWLVALALSWRITSPLHKLVTATGDIARGRYQASVLNEIDQSDEIGQLAAAFREMAVRLREVDSRDRRFLMSISHELRTPLTAITGHAQALEDGLAEDPESRDRSLAVIRREAGRLDRLVEDIIDLARLRSNRFNTVTETVSLDELGGHLMAIFEDEASHPGIAVRGDFEHVDFHSDGHRILQILRNLVNNALRYATTEVAVTGERVKSRIRITVANDGEPVPEEMHERIFEPFVGSKREGGMGLGLAIGRELAWALGGNLRYVPSNAGAIFEVTLPLEPPGSGR